MSSFLRDFEDLSTRYTDLHDTLELNLSSLLTKFRVDLTNWAMGVLLHGFEIMGAL